MTINASCHFVKELCANHQMTKDDFIDIFLSENLKLCIYLSDLKTYYFDFKLVDYELDSYNVHACFSSGLFYLTSYEACKVLCNGESFVSRIQPAGEMFITLAHPQRILFDDLLLDSKSWQQLNCTRFNRARIVSYSEAFSG